MEEAHRLLNPWTLHLQKLALELKCPICLQLLNRPTMLPCDHIICNSCIPKETQLGFECPACRHQFVDRDVKPLLFMENIVSIYRNLDATFNANILQPLLFDGGKVSAPHAAENSRKEPAETPQEGNSSSGQAMVGNCSHPSYIHGDAAKHPAKRSAEDGGLTDLKLSNKCTSGAKCHTTDLKRQKKISEGFDDKGAEITGPPPSLAPSTCNKETKLENPLSGGKSPVAMDPMGSKGNPCAFCHSTGQTDGTGPMVSYANGKQVVGNDANFSKVIHVHEKCIGWMPQIYFEDGIIKNLDLEVARANKLKCSSCGKKGAGLGCFVESCSRTYHVPCAYYILECRWDCEDFLLLCPKHVSHSFPSEARNPKKNGTEKRILTPLKPCTPSSHARNNLLFCESALSPEEKYSLVEFARACGATLSKFWRPNVTHVIAATDSKGACTRSMKILMAILNGKWVLKMEWVKACVEAGHIVNEEPYEVSLDNHGCSGGPKAGRQRVLDKAPKLFNSLNFYFSGDYAQAFKDDLVNLVITGGGNVVENKDRLSAVATTVVYNADKCEFEDKDSIRFQAKDVARETGSNVVGHTWILESVAACSLLPYHF